MKKQFNRMKQLANQTVGRRVRGVELQGVAPGRGVGGGGRDGFSPGLETPPRAAAPPEAGGTQGCATLHRDVQLGAALQPGSLSSGSPLSIVPAQWSIALGGLEPILILPSL
jgi:hypothetical protein